MLSLIYVFLFQYIIQIQSEKDSVINTGEGPTIDIEPFVINIYIPHINICEEINTNDCKNLIDQMLKCQQIIFNNSGFSYQQYKSNIDVHRKILAKYQAMCESTQNDYLAND